MKDNLNIEELFKQKFESFEGNVPADAWANIQQGMAANGAVGAGVATKSISGAFKVGLISTGVVAATVTSVVLLQPNDVNENTIVSDENSTIEIVDPIKNSKTTYQSTYVLKESDPISNDLFVEETERLNTVSEDNENSTNSNVVTTLEQTNDESANAVEDRQTTVNAVEDRDQNEGTNQDVNQINGDQAEGKPSNNTRNRIENETNVKTVSGDFEVENQETFGECLFKSNAQNQKEVYWDFGDGTTAIGEEVKYTYEKPGNYEVTLTIVGENDVFEETQAVEIKGALEIIRIPNSFTPNNDGTNDTYFIEAEGAKLLFIVIRDLRGKIVFQSDQLDFEWDGNDQSGKELPEGNYLYNLVIESVDGEPFSQKGLIRLER